MSAPLPIFTCKDPQGIPNDPKNEFIDCDSDCQKKCLIFSPLTPPTFSRQILRPESMKLMQKTFDSWSFHTSFPILHKANMERFKNSAKDPQKSIAQDKILSGERALFSGSTIPKIIVEKSTLQTEIIHMSKKGGHIPYCN